MCYLCMLEIYMTLVWEISSAITDVHHQAGLLLVYTHNLMMQGDANAVTGYHSETKMEEHTKA